MLKTYLICKKNLTKMKNDLNENDSGDYFSDSGDKKRIWLFLIINLADLLRMLFEDLHKMSQYYMTAKGLLIHKRWPKSAKRLLSKAKN